MDVILNGEPFFLEKAEISYDEICKAAGMKPKTEPNVVYSIRHGGVFHLLSGQKAHLTEGAVITVGSK